MSSSEQSRSPSPADMPRRRFDAPSPMDGPTREFPQPDLDAPSRLAFDDLSDDDFMSLSADEMIGRIQGTQETAEHEASQTPYATYFKENGAQFAPLFQERDDLGTAVALHEALKHAPDQTGDIVEVIGKVRHDKAFDQASPHAMWPHEEILLELGKSEVKRQIEQDKLQNVDFALDDDPLGKVRHVHNALQAAIDNETNEANKSKLQRDEAAVKDYIDWSTADKQQELAAMRKTTASAYYDKAKEHFSGPVTDEVIEASRVVKRLTAINEQEARALQFLSGYVDKMDGQTDSSEETDETAEQDQTVAEALDAARTAYATLQASRQKKVFGFDRKNPYMTVLGNKADESRKIEKTYREAVQARIAEDIKERIARDGQFEDETAINEFIATRTVDEALALDKETIAEYGKTNGRLSKVINWMAGRNANGEIDDSLRAKIRRGTLRYAVPVAFLGLSIATGGSLAVAAASGAYATAKLYSNFEVAGRESRMQKTPGLLNKEDVIANLQTPQSGLIFDKEEGEYREMTIGEATFDKMVRSTELISDAANHETKWQKIHATKRLLGAVALGIGAAVGSRMIGHWINGADSHAVGGDHQGDVPQTPQTPPAPTPEVPSAPLPSHEFAPGTFYAHQNDGFFQILKNMGVEASQRDDVLAKASKELFKQGYAYKMNDGLPGIPRVGNLPQGAIDILTKAAGK